MPSPISSDPCCQQQEIVDLLCTRAKSIRGLKANLLMAVEAGDLDRLSSLRREYDEICATLIADVDRLAAHRLDHNC
jgi:hypothetical protein